MSFDLNFFPENLDANYQREILDSKLRSMWNEYSKHENQADSIEFYILFYPKNLWHAIHIDKSTFRRPV